MLRSLKDLERYKIVASDGEVGHVANFLFDDERWGVRFLVAETGGFFTSRCVLVSPISFREVDWTNHRFHLGLTMAKIEHAPGVDTAKPVSRQHERAFYGHYGYPFYWNNPSAWALGAYPAMIAPAVPSPREPAAPPGDAHLRSVNEVRGYEIRGTDGAIGQVADFIVDDEGWALRYLVVDTGGWWWGKRVLLAPHWASEIRWGERAVFVGLTRQQIKASPAWNADTIVHRGYEGLLYDHYGRRAYWADDDGTKAKPTSAETAL